MINLLKKYFLISLLIIFSVLSNELSGQIGSLDSLRTSISNSEKILEKLKLQKEAVSLSFDRINSKIYRLKLNLSNSDNPLTRIELNKNLKESNLYADSIETLNLLIRRSTSLLSSQYKDIISILNELILSEQNKFKKETNTQTKINIFEKVRQLDDERQKYQNLISKQTPAINLKISLNIEPGDTYNTIQLKIDIVNDRINSGNDERRLLFDKQKELRSELSIYQDMVDFMNDLRLNIDEEQEFYDRDRVNQLRYNIKQIKNKIQNIDERLKSIDKEEKLFMDKLDKLKKHLNSLLKPIK